MLIILGLPVALALAPLYLPALIGIGTLRTWVFGARGSCLHSFAGQPILVRLRSAQFETFFDSNDMSQPFGSSRDVIKSRYALLTPDGFFTFDFPGSTFTSLNGINSQGYITGRYVDASGIAHGFIARVRGTPPTKAAGTEMKAFDSRSLVTPLDQSPSAWGDAMRAR